MQCRHLCAPHQQSEQPHRHWPGSVWPELADLRCAEPPVAKVHTIRKPLAVRWLGRQDSDLHKSVSFERKHLLAKSRLCLLRAISRDLM